MVFLSNGQNESSSSSGDNSGSGSNSVERRFCKKSGNSQRQQSSSSSASSSDSEQVSTRLAAEKPSDRSRVRNQGTLSEPNCEAHSASKPKRVAAKKRVKDDGAAEEQPVEEEAATSKPRKKKLRKQQKESVAVVAQATSLLKDLPQKSSQKTAHAWTDKDDAVIMNGYLVCVKEGSEFPKSIPQLIEKTKYSLAYETSKTQLYKKLRTMKGRYEYIKNNMVQGNSKEGAFSYKTSHEKELYQLWKKAWGAQPEGDKTEAESSRDGMEVETEGESGTDTVKVSKASKALGSNQFPDNALVSLMPMPNDKPEDRFGYKTFMKETRDVLVEVTRVVKKMVENSEAETRALLDILLGSANGTCGAGGGAGRRVNSAVWLRNRESDLEAIPSVDEAKVQAMERKWRELQICALQLGSKRYALLQEECSMQMEALKASSQKKCSK